jgi:colanic acid/amylovoran biosynthesis glycosyltransferase
MKYALDACKLLDDANFNFQLLIISTHGINEEVQFQLDQLGLKEKVKIEAQLDQDALFEVIKSSDALLLTSLNEGIANVVLEAMALGVPVVSSNCGGMSEVVKHKETGWLVPIRDTIAISEAIMEIWKTPEQELQRITYNAHHFVKQHFNANEAIHQFMELYEHVVERS